MRALDKKVVRDLAKMWAQSLAIALVMACGVATIVIALGAYRSLDGTREAFYERGRFGTVFSSAVRAPKSLELRLRLITGVSSVALRIKKPILLDIPGMSEPASGLLISLPDRREPTVNRLYLRNGRLPVGGNADEVAIVETFAKAHGLRPGDTFAVIMGGTRRRLRVTGIVLSPEFVYSIGPGDLVPDERRFGIGYMPYKALAATFSMQGAFNDLALTTLRDANLQQVVEQVDDLLEPYGGTGAYQRKDQISHSFLDAELQQLRAMAMVIPPIFLGVSAFLVNMILSRLLALEREQIGLLKALGYNNAAVAVHYAKIVIVIALVGVAIGSAAGFWLGRGLTRLFATFYSFPFLLFKQSIDLYLIAGGVTVTAAIAGSGSAIRRVVKLPPAVAMRAPAPSVYKSFFGGRLRSLAFLSQLTVMALRNLARRPLRAGFTILGISLSTALLITSLFSNDSLDFMIETIFFRAERSDATLVFANDLSPRAGASVRSLPGVIRVEVSRTEPVTIRRGHRSLKSSLTGVPSHPHLLRVLDTALRPMVLPSQGLVISERVASKLKVRLGDVIDIEFNERNGHTHTQTVSGIAQSYVGLASYMRLEALDRLVGEGPRINAARLSIDPVRKNALYRAIKETPSIASIALTDLSRQKLRDTIRQNITIQMSVYIALAVIITFGVVYNFARIQLSERARELASLRVFGFTRAEVSGVLFVELSLLVLLAQPLGWAIGAGLAWAVVQGFATDLFRIPLVLEPRTFATATLIVLGAALASALVVRRRVDTLDLVRVLKTRE